MLDSGSVQWRARVYFKGRIVAQRSFDRRTDARQWEADQIARLREGTWIDPARGRVAFDKIAEDWQQSRQHLAMRSQETTRFLLDAYILPALGRVPIGSIAPLDVERLLTELTARGLATATRRRVLSVIRLVLDHAIRDRRLGENVARDVELPRGRTKREPHWLRAEELKRLADTTPATCRPVVLFLGLSGCRFSEMAALRVDDVIQTQHGLGVRVHRAAPQSKQTHAAVIGSTKTHRTRTVPVPVAVERYVVDRVAQAAPGDYLFPSPTGVIWTNTNFRHRAKWHQTTAAAGLAGTTIHDLRHTAATLLIASGADLKAVQTILGHASATMTMDLYGHMFSDAPWLAMARMPTWQDDSAAGGERSGEKTDGAAQ
ncbi:tyrosine-type recombinase/integrase [Actinotalea ferrariae]|uniref:tyrosine-type recombinase/integrase n=1 Tax=Actinotalea ferrariae TaxID=1386098 RepID=UPI0027E1B7F1|nr:site-specific integrase [Actinotalea ferrariae]